MGNKTINLQTQNFLSIPSPYRILTLSCLIILIVALGFFRDFVFVNINAHLQYLSRYSSRNYAHLSFEFLQSYSYQTIFYGKFALTLIFTLLYLLLSVITVHILFEEKRYKFYTVITFTAIFLLAFGMYLLGKLTGWEEHGYTISRQLMGFVQSPVTLMILVPFFWGIKNNKIKV